MDDFSSPTKPLCLCVPLPLFLVLGSSQADPEAENKEETDSANQAEVPQQNSFSFFAPIYSPISISPRRFPLFNDVSVHPVRRRKKVTKKTKMGCGRKRLDRTRTASLTVSRHLFQLELILNQTVDVGKGHFTNGDHVN